MWSRAYSALPCLMQLVCRCIWCLESNSAAIGASWPRSSELFAAQMCQTDRFRPWFQRLKANGAFTALQSVIFAKEERMHIRAGVPDSNEDVHNLRPAPGVHHHHRGHLARTDRAAKTPAAAQIGAEPTGKNMSKLYSSPPSSSSSSAAAPQPPPFLPFDFGGGGAPAAPNRLPFSPSFFSISSACARDSISCGARRAELGA